MISRFFIDRPIFAAVLSIVITLAGGLALVTVPIAMYPPISPPTIQMDCTYPGASAEVVSETVAINPALAISGIEIMNNWYYRPDYMAIMSNCANTQIGVWSENSFDRSVVVAVYGQPG